MQFWKTTFRGVSGKHLASVVIAQEFSSTLFSNLIMEATYPSEKSVYIYQITRRHIPQSSYFHNHSVRLPDLTKESLLPWTPKTGWFL